ncbi:hypothetical protein KSS87_021193 [Heliosperma pusillum]|nr:hypothetical protein KSS87_021193 [Heliosperma pusillum]
MEKGDDVVTNNGVDVQSYRPFDVEESVIGDINETNVDSKIQVSPANVLKTLFFICVWYNKSLLGDDMGKFPAPLLMNTFHFSMQAVLSKAITWIWYERFHKGSRMTWRDYFTRVVPTALATSLDINLSNASLVFISVTFATMCKSAAPIFLLIFAFAFRLESPSLKLFGIILVISFGILLTVAKDTEFELWGFIFVMLAAIMSGFRWCMTQILLQSLTFSAVCCTLLNPLWLWLLPSILVKKEAYGLKNPLTFMSYVTPIMAIATGLMSLLLDPWDEFPTNVYFDSPWHVMKSCLLMLFGGTLAFFMVLTEYVLISVTSAVTVTIAGIVKEAVTIVVAVFYFHDEFTWLIGIGLLIIMVGVSLFNWYKYQKLQEGQSNAIPGEGSLAANASAKYVILEEEDDQNDGLDGSLTMDEKVCGIMVKTWVKFLRASPRAILWVE